MPDQKTTREQRLEALIRQLLRRLDSIAYRDNTGLRLGDAMPVIADMRAEVGYAE